MPDRTWRPTSRGCCCGHPRPTPRSCAHWRARPGARLVRRVRGRTLRAPPRPQAPCPPSLPPWWWPPVCPLPPRPPPACGRRASANLRTRPRCPGPTACCSRSTRCSPPSAPSACRTTPGMTPRAAVCRSGSTRATATTTLPPPAPHPARGPVSTEHSLDVLRALCPLALPLHGPSLLQGRRYMAPHYTLLLTRRTAPSPRASRSRRTPPGTGGRRRSPFTSREASRTPVSRSTARALAPASDSLTWGP